MGLYHSPSIVQDGLVLCLDAANPKSYPGSGTTWYDLSPNKYNATLNSSPIYDSANKGSFILDGTSYISITNQSNFNLSVFTYSGWLLNTSSSLYWDRILSKKNSYSDTDGYEISVGTGASSTLYVSGSGSTFATPTVVNWTDNKWHNLVVVFNNTSITTYCDGVNTGGGDIDTVVSNGRNLNLGRLDGEAGVTQWRGKMANIAIYNRGLLATEVNQNFNALRGRYGI